MGESDEVAGDQESETRYVHPKHIVGKRLLFTFFFGGGGG